jgi:hypothetical protein
MKQFVIDTMPLGHPPRVAPELLRDRFGRVQDIRRKENVSSIVTEVDLASEALILERIRQQFPDHNIVAEESGFEGSWVGLDLGGRSAGRHLELRGWDSLVRRDAGRLARDHPGPGRHVPAP